MVNAFLLLFIVEKYDQANHKNVMCQKALLLWGAWKEYVGSDMTQPTYVDWVGRRWAVWVWALDAHAWPEWVVDLSCGTPQVLTALDRERVEPADQVPQAASQISERFHVSPLSVGVLT